MTEQERFWSLVDKTGPCWLWAGPKQSAGYGFFYARGRSFLAHRYAYGIQHLDEPVSELHHECHKQLCVLHVVPTSHRENCWLNKSRLDEYCRNGHLWADSQANRPNGTRYCRQCKREQENEARRLFGRSDTKRGRWYK